MVRVVGSVVDVAFPAGPIPGILHALRTPQRDDRATDLVLEVCTHLGGHVVRTVAMHATDGLQLGQEVADSGQPIRVPVGEGVLGRILDVIGDPADELGPVQAEVSWPIHRPAPAFADRTGAIEVLETGIKVVDLFAPCPRGGRIGLFVEERARETSLVLELARNLAERRGGRSVFARIGGRTREGTDLWSEMQACALVSRSVLVSARASEPPGARARVALAAVTLAERFRDEGARDVLLLLDDLPGLVQAHTELSLLLGRLPSASGTAPTLSADLGALQERIAATRRGAITAVGVVRGPLDPTDPASAAVLDTLDAKIVLSSRISELGLLPPVEPLGSTSRILDPQIVGEEHHRVAGEAKRLLRRYLELQDTIALLGMDELAAEDRRTVARARKLRFFLTQPLHTAEVFTGRAGVYVEARDTVRGVREIVEGSCDDLPEDAFIMVGTIESVREKARRLSV